MPTAQFDDESSFAPDRSAGGTDLGTQQQMVKLTVPQYYGGLTQLGLDAAMAPLDLADTILSSKLTSWIPGAPQRGQITEAVTDWSDRNVFHALGMPGFGNFYQNNKEGVATASGLLGSAAIVGAELLFSEVTIPAALALRGISKIPWVRRIATLDTEYANALDTVRKVDASLAKAGAMGNEEFLGETAIEALRYQKGGGFALEDLKIGRQTAFTDMKRVAFAKGARKAAGQEITMGILLNSNESIYTDSEAQNMMWSTLGILGGAFGESVHAVYSARKYVNSDEIRRFQAAALDPRGWEEDRLKALSKGINATPIEESEGFLGGSHSDLANSYFVGAERLENDVATLPAGMDGVNLAARRGQMATQQRQQGMEQVQKIVTQGISTQGTTRFSNETPGYGHMILELLEHDKTTFAHAEMIGGIPEELTAQGIHDAHIARLDERILITEKTLAKGKRIDAETRGEVPLTKEDSRALTRLRKRLEFEKTLVPMVAIDGEWVPLSQAAAIEGFENPIVRFEAYPRDPNIKGPQDTHGIFSSVIPGEHNIAPVTVGTDLQIHFPSGASINDADHFDILRGYRAFNRAIDHVVKFGGPIPVHENANWMTLDAIEEVLTRSDGAANILWPQGMTRESAKVESIAQKAEAAEMWREKIRQESLVKAYKRGPKPGTREYSVAPAGNGQWNIVVNGTPRVGARNPIYASKGAAMDAVNAEVKQNPELRSFGPRVDASDIDSQWAKLRVRFNLPQLTAYEQGILGTTEHPIEALMRGIMAYGPEKIRQMGYNELVQAAMETRKITDVAPVTFKDMQKFTGNSFRYMLSSDGKHELKPLIAYKRPFKANEYTQAFLAERMASQKAHMIDILTNEEADPFTRELTLSRLASTDFHAAADTRGLKETQIQGAFQNGPNSSAYGSIGKSAITSEMRDRDNLTNLGASRNFSEVTRIAQEKMKQIINDTFGDSLNVLKGPRSVASRVLLNQFHSVSGGWDLEPIAAVVNTADKNMHHFVLADTVKNQQRWERSYGTALPKGQYLMNELGQPVALDDLAMDLQKRFNIVSEQVRQFKNTILRSQGLGEIKATPWYVAPPDLEGKFIGQVYDAFDRQVPQMGIVAETKEQYDAQKKVILEKMHAMGLGYTFRSQQDVKEYANIFDKAAMDMISPSTTAIQPGKVNKGILSSMNTRLNAFDDSMKYLQDSVLTHAHDVNELLLKEQIQSATARSVVAREVEANNPQNKAGIFNYRSIHDYYLENLTGKSKLNSDQSPFAQVVKGVEGSIDAFLKEPTVKFQIGRNIAMNAAGKAFDPFTSRVWKALNAWTGRPNSFSSSPAAIRDFNALSEALGEYNPFKSSAEWLQANHQVPVPWTSEKMSRDMSQFASAMLLRVMEFGQPAMNMAGIVDAMPAVIRQMTPRNGQSMEEFATEIGRVADIFTSPSGQTFGVLNMGKAAGRGLKLALNPKMNPHYDRLVSKGYLTQEVAETLKQFSAIKSRSTFNRFFMGNENIKNPANLSESLAQKGVVGWMSVLSDSSEDLSRAWAHMTGMEIGHSLGIRSVNDLDSYAHDFANKLIANYSPQNRPEIFKGAIGTPLGLFQAYAQNYYQRLFRYVETKNVGALAWQLGMQGTMFGATGMPGFKQFNQLMSFADHKWGDEEEDSEDPHHGVHDPESRLLSAFTSKNTEDPSRFRARDMIAGGVVSNIPTLFGLPAVDFAGRGDITARIPGADPLPSVAVIGKIWEGIGTAVDIFTNKHPAMTKTQIAEVLANSLANRPLAGMIETFMSHGNDTDASGQLVSETHGLMESTYRILGLKSMRQSEETRAFYSNKNAQAYQAAAMDRLRYATRAAIREKNPDAIAGAFKGYVEQGGDPAHFRRWFQDSYRAATMTRGQRQLWDAMQSDDMESAARLMDAGVTVDADERTPDPQLMYGTAGRENDPNEELNQDTGSLGNYPDQITTQAGEAEY